MHTKIVLTHNILTNIVLYFLKLRRTLKKRRQEALIGLFLVQMLALLTIERIEDCHRVQRGCKFANK
jgi:hypothetical protein